MSRWGLATHEAKYLPEVIHPDEDIGGVVYGFSENGYAMLVVTDRRALLIDRKPLFTNEDDISFDVISGVELSSVGYLSTVVLHTRIKDYTIKTYNKKCARGFINYIESRCIEYQSRGQWRG